MVKQPREGSMSFPNSSFPSRDANNCPQCQAAGLTICQHVRQVCTSQPSAQKADLDPTTSAVLLKGAILGALFALGYFAWRSREARIEESVTQTVAQRSFDEWEPNQ